MGKANIVNFFGITLYKVNRMHTVTRDKLSLFIAKEPKIYNTSIFKRNINLNKGENSENNGRESD